MTRLLVMGSVWPEPNSSAAGSRMLQLLEYFTSENYQITFVTTAAPSPFAVDLKKMKIASKVVKMNHPSFDDLLKSLEPELVLFDRFMTEEQFGWRVNQCCPRAIKILDTQDLHFLRKARADAFKKNLPVQELYYDSDITKREIASIYRCDLSLIISNMEMDLLKNDFRLSESLLHYLPFMLDPLPKEEIEALASFKQRKDFICIGNFLHQPNWDAVLYLKEEIWPLIRQKLPQANLNIYGAYPSQKVWNLHNEKEGFLVKGRAESAQAVMKSAKVCLAPLRFGAGLKGKLVEAMQCGTPSVTTSVGSEGIGCNSQWNGFISEQAKDFAEKAVILYSKESIWNSAAKKGFPMLNSRFNKKEHQQQLSKRLADLSRHLKLHRQENFMGKMLQHHQHRSTYFMSKFIEEKEKNRR